MLTILKKVGCGISVSIILSTACSSKTVDLAKGENANRINSNRVVKDEELYYLDLNKPSIVQPIDPKLQNVEAFKFVQVEVAEVVNPKKYPLAFKVFYQSGADEKLYLGSFGLYPSDNPGKFIVATQGKLKKDGAIILTLEIPDNVAASDTIKVGVKKIKLVNA
jgi:hypothetical protein